MPFPEMKQQPGAASGEPTREVGTQAGEFAWDEQAVRKLVCEIWNNYAKDPEWCVKRIIGVLERAAGPAAQPPVPSDAKRRAWADEALQSHINDVVDRAQEGEQAAQPLSRGFTPCPSKGCYLRAGHKGDCPAQREVGERRAWADKLAEEFGLLVLEKGNKRAWSVMDDRWCNTKATDSEEG